MIASKSKTPASHVCEMIVRAYNGRSPIYRQKVNPKKNRKWFILTKENYRQGIPVPGDLRIPTGEFGHARVRVTIEYLASMGHPEDVGLTTRRKKA